VLATHVDRVAWLYPTPLSNPQAQPNGVTDPPPPKNTTKYRPFLDVEQQVRRNLRALFAAHTPSSPDALTPAPPLAGALSTVLATINTRTLLAAPLSHPTSDPANPSPSGGGGTGGGAADPGAASLDAHTTESRRGASSSAAAAPLVARALYVSASAPSADLSGQYVGLMNAVFAAQRLRVPVDVLRVGGARAPAFLQQACDATGGVFLSFEPPAARGGAGAGAGGKRNDAVAMGLLQTLMMAYLPDATARASLVTPGSAEVDFRAACFCHGKVVDLGGVCSVCLSSEFPV
jgi:transcription initiation factor TFIIH subunit 3